MSPELWEQQEEHCRAINRLMPIIRCAIREKCRLDKAAVPVVDERRVFNVDAEELKTLNGLGFKTLAGLRLRVATEAKP